MTVSQERNQYQMERKSRTRRAHPTRDGRSAHGRQDINMNEKKEALRIEILKYIEKHSRVNLGELATLIGTEETEVANEMAEMEKEKIICGYHTLIDWDKAGVEMVTALIEVRVTPQRDRGFDRIAERIYNYPEVNAVYLISGSYDLLVTLEGKTLREVSRFVSEKLSPIDEVLSTATHFILKKYKDHGTIMVPRKESERMLVTP